MERKPLPLLIPLLMLAIVGGVLTILLSFTALLPPGTNLKGMRTIGFLLAFVGLGEYLNHPAQEKLYLPDPHATKPIRVPHRSRNPCALGNVLDVLGLIMAFIAVALYFFPHDGS